ncbi:zinc finger protein ZAT5 [Cajanus cajan]|uniref:zinc finger protein ZAT5 n=1 Tax=Cajanus cajan TaxID=3821 RepID=UPI00098D84BB|nr:zinc finger protein ZAT5 [Cajanus cajan]
MEAPEELKDHTNILKGKRTKRVRPQSPIPFSITANSSTGGDGDREEEEEDCNNNNLRINNNNNNNNNNSQSSPTTSSAGLQDSTDEEEDMANCLILLAQGQSREPQRLPAEEDGGMSYAKYSSRKFLEAATLGSSRAGYYVYECKTCNRTFPSFQALGGHRASHKKPKAMMGIGQEKKHQLLLSSDEEEFQFKTNKSPFSLQLNNNNSKGNLYTSNNNKSKVHECSICGAEFTSGQALGGHMRRHRAPVGTAIPAAATTLSFTPLPLEPEEDHPRKKRNVLNLDLDLNLPAPEDDQRESKFAFASKQQQQHGQKQQQQQQQQTSLVFPAPALVDCHY